ncbi:linoleate diol synthase and cytochrome P450 domain-containing protein [Phanerochaete sordida]|uniref:Linoleate diol synthase and cytochrome P450 domain-containing protein n=1 Tax=Phanerochaete sordida TaxID=48140 RepID=A0A9P3G7Z7_9APHY|nr:linoleate diol synthase and cytochrome P450 domain-containing protein [Phanerochaete sordida]
MEACPVKARRVFPLGPQPLVVVSLAPSPPPKSAEMATSAKGPSKHVHRASSYTSAPHDAHEDDSFHASLKVIDHFRQTIMKDLSMIDIASIPGIIDAIKHSDAIDDRKFLLEHLLMFLSKLPEGPLSTSLQNRVIELLYNDLPHPPSTYIGNQYAFRTADGSYNNVTDPDMGKAGTPYSRSVQQAHPLGRREMPDAGLIFDTLLRREKFVEHPAGLSSMMFSFAALVIHTVFRTSHENVSINETSSYVDLAPLYGCNADAQKKIRVFDGRGVLYPDTFSEDRLMLLPPAVCVLLVLFSRNHNYIARKLLEINERGTWTEPDAIPADDQERTKKIAQQDEEIYQTARLINCAWFGTAIFSDYFSAILGLVRQGSSWSLNPFGEIRNEDRTLFERGRGNVCSVEFNCLYRWHATTSQYDENWVEKLTAHLFQNRDPDTLTPMDLKKALVEIQATEPDVTHWTFGNMQRQTEGPYKGWFKDEDLAQILMLATEHPAGAFGARHTPSCMRLHEVMGIEASRRWGCCSLNDFRKFLGLKPYATFLEWNSNKEIANAAEKLYGDIDHLELYTGLQAEEAKPVMDGAGLCPSYTVSRAILADAIALTRGDRFFTADYTPFNLTSWGFQDCQRDPSAPGYGSTLGRLFMRTLPNHYNADSTYTWFPLMTPQAMEKVLKGLGDIDLYNMQRPSAGEDVLDLAEYRDAAQVLGGGAFVPLTEGRAADVIRGKGFFLASSDPAAARRGQEAMLQALTGAPGSEEKITEFFFAKTGELMAKESWSVSKKQVRNVDIVRDVLKYVPIYWASDVAGIRLSDVDADGSFTPKKLFDMLTEIYEFMFLDFEASKYMNMVKSVRGHVGVLLKHIKAVHSSGTLSSLVSAFASLFVGQKDDWHARFAALGYDDDTLANSILAVLVGCSVELSQALIHTVNFYLDENTTGQVKINGVSGSSKPNEKAQELQGIALEALRLDPPFAGVYREAIAAQKVGRLSIPAGGKVFVNVSKANMDPDVFPDPASVNPNRSGRGRYMVSDGSALCLGLDLTSKIAAEVLRAVWSFKNVRRASGQSGVLRRYKSDTMRTSNWMYLNQAQQQSPWATSMVLQYDC